MLVVENVVADLVGTDKSEVLDELATLLSINNDSVDAEALLELLLEREKLGSTGIGHGVAIPHAKLKGINSIQICFGRCKKGIDFDSKDRKKFHLCFLIVAPEDSTTIHLKVLSAVSGLLKEASVRHKLLVANGRDDICEIIRNEEKKNFKGAVA